MRNLVLLLLLLAQSAAGQSWCTPGAQWAYRHHNPWGENFIDVHTYLGDTLFQGYMAQHIGVLRSGFWVSAPPLDEFMRTEGDVIYAWSFSSPVGWDTLYWLGNPGNQWWPIGADESCSPGNLLQIVDTGSVILDGVHLRTWDVTYTSAQNPAWTYTSQLVERIGMPTRYFLWQPCDGGVIDYNFTDFLCYHDMDIGTPCDILLNTNVAVPQGVISASPNPGEHEFRVTGLNGTCMLEVHDALGRAVHTARISEGSVVDAAGWPLGCYTLRIAGRLGERSTLRWLKQ